MAEPFNLDEVDESVDFVLNGKTYRLNLPTTEQIVAAQELETPEERNTFVYGLVSAVEKDTPEFSEAISKANILKAKRFREMIAEVIGI